MTIRKNKKASDFSPAAEKAAKFIRKLKKRAANLKKFEGFRRKTLFQTATVLRQQFDKDSRFITIWESIANAIDYKIDTQIEMFEGIREAKKKAKFNEIKDAMRLAEEFFIFSKEPYRVNPVTKEEFLDTLVLLEASDKLDEYHHFGLVPFRNIHVSPEVVVRILFIEI